MISIRLMSLTGLLVVGAIFIAACEAAEPEIVPTPVFHPTPAPVGDVPDAPSTADTATAMDPLATSVEITGDIDSGESLFGSSGCSGCHSTGANRLVGPGLSGVGSAAETRVAGLTANEYLTASIVAPGDFVVPEYSNIMPATFGDTLSEQEIADLVAYLVSLP